MHGFRIFLPAVLVGGAAFALQVSRPGDHDSAKPTGRDRVESAASQDRVAAAQAGMGGGCKEVGAFDESFTFNDRYRGNAYRIQKTVRLVEIQMRLGMDQPNTLHVAIHQKQQDGSWDRYPPGQTDYIIEVTEDDVTGFANPIFYSTGALPNPVILEEGFDYAIGFAWQDNPVRFGKDVFRTYPQATPADFDFGQVLGGVADNGVEPLPLPDEFPFLIVSGTPPNGGAYSMQLCVTGACCIGSDCLDLTENACLGEFGQFTASGVTCEEVALNGDACPLLRGACCHQEGQTDTCAPVNEYACDGLDGEWFQGVACHHPTLEPCEPRGGCCFTDGECFPNHTVTSCSSLGGIYRGDNVTCEAFPRCTAGACCDGTTCSVELTVGDCENDLCPDCVFGGPGTNCVGNPCIPRGACCNAATGACEDGVTQTTCQSSGRSFRGAGSTCASVSPPCGRGACCLAGIGCQDSDGAGMSSTFCQNTLGGTFRGDGSTCENINPRCNGVCCWLGAAKDSCVAGSSPESCETKISGTFIDYEAACPRANQMPPDPNPCGPVTSTNGQACCLPHGQCVNVYSATDARSLCEDGLRGTFTAGMQCHQIECRPPPPLGSCCNRTAYTCDDDVVREDCLGFPNQWTLNVDCDHLANPCEPRGACCNPAGPSCTNGKLSSECPPPMEWTAQSVCDDLDPPCAATGACCIGEVCEVTTFSSCFTRGGDYQGDDSPCDDELCRAPRGACCLDHACFIATFVGCFEDGGTYLGDKTVCEAETCVAMGACCVDEACSISTQAGCTGEYQGDDTVCEADTCLETGACCEDNGACGVEPQETCEGRGAAFVGVDTSCNDDPCERGACCDTTCTCSDDVFRHVCEGSGGAFFGQESCINLGGCPLKIAASEPPDCVIDAREHPPLPGAIAREIDSLTLTMSCEGAHEADFAVENSPADPASAIDQVLVAGTGVRVLLEAPIPVDGYTCVRHVPSNSRACVGYLPGDTDGSGTTDTEDITALRQDLEANRRSLPAVQCDADRSGACTVLDILRNVDLQNGADPFDTWGGHPLPAPCPNAGP